MRPTVLPPKDRERHIAPLARLLETVFPGKPVRVKVEIAQPDKTPAQNRYLWAVPYKMLSAETGMESEDIHEWNCGNQWGWKTKRVPKKPGNEVGVEQVPIRTTTTDENGEDDPCSMEDMLALWARAQKLGASLGVVIPDPDPDYFKKRKAA
jgi:hypothetical protein